jgi:hypothetical protein
LSKKKNEGSIFPLLISRFFHCSAVTVSNNAPAAFPLGTNLVTWTARDARGNTSACQQKVNRWHVLESEYSLQQLTNGLPREIRINVVPLDGCQSKLKRPPVS